MLKTILAGTAAAALLAGTAFAQSKTQYDPGDPAAPTAATADAPAPDEFVESQSTSEMLASSLIGKTVRNVEDERIADISDLVVDESGRVTAAVLGVGGFLGMGGRTVAVPIEALETVTNADGDVEVVMHLTRDELDDAPAFVDLRTQRAQQAAERAASQAPTGGIGMN